MIKKILQHLNLIHYYNEYNSFKYSQLSIKLILGFIFITIPFTLIYIIMKFLDYILYYGIRMLTRYVFILSIKNIIETFKNMIRNIFYMLFSLLLPLTNVKIFFFFLFFGWLILPTNLDILDWKLHDYLTQHLCNENIVTLKHSKSGALTNSFFDSENPYDNHFKKYLKNKDISIKQFDFFDYRRQLLSDFLVIEGNNNFFKTSPFTKLYNSLPMHKDGKQLQRHTLVFETTEKGDKHNRLFDIDFYRQFQMKRNPRLGPGWRINMTGIDYWTLKRVFVKGWLPYDQIVDNIRFNKSYNFFYNLSFYFNYFIMDLTITDGFLVVIKYSLINFFLNFFDGNNFNFFFINFIGFKDKIILFLLHVDDFFLLNFIVYIKISVCTFFNVIFEDLAGFALKFNSFFLENRHSTITGYSPMEKRSAQQKQATKLIRADTLRNARKLKSSVLRRIMNSELSFNYNNDILNPKGIYHNKLDDVFKHSIVHHSGAIFRRRSHKIFKLPFSAVSTTNIPFMPIRAYPFKNIHNYTCLGIRRDPMMTEAAKKYRRFFRFYNRYSNFKYRPRYRELTGHLMRRKLGVLFPTYFRGSFINYFDFLYERIGNKHLKYNKRLSYFTKIYKNLSINVPDAAYSSNKVGRFFKLREEYHTYTSKKGLLKRGKYRDGSVKHGGPRTLYQKNTWRRWSGITTKRFLFQTKHLLESRRMHLSMFMITDKRFRFIIDICYGIFKIFFYPIYFIFINPLKSLLIYISGMFITLFFMLLFVRFKIFIFLIRHYLLLSLIGLKKFSFKRGTFNIRDLLNKVISETASPEENINYTFFSMSLRNYNGMEYGRSELYRTQDLIDLYNQLEKDNDFLLQQYKYNVQESNKKKDGSGEKFEEPQLNELELLELGGGDEFIFDLNNGKYSNIFGFKDMLLKKFLKKTYFLDIQRYNNLVSSLKFSDLQKNLLMFNLSASNKLKASYFERVANDLYNNEDFFENKRLKLKDYLRSKILTIKNLPRNLRSSDKLRYKKTYLLFNLLLNDFQSAFRYKYNKSHFFLRFLNILHKVMLKRKGFLKNNQRLLNEFNFNNRYNNRKSRYRGLSKRFLEIVNRRLKNNFYSFNNFNYLFNSFNFNYYLKKRVLKYKNFINNPKTQMIEIKYNYNFFIRDVNLKTFIAPNLKRIFCIFLILNFTLLYYIISNFFITFYYTFNLIKFILGVVFVFVKKNYNFITGFSKYFIILILNNTLVFLKKLLNNLINIFSVKYLIYMCFFYTIWLMSSLLLFSFKVLLFILLVTIIFICFNTYLESFVNLSTQHWLMKRTFQDINNFASRDPSISANINHQRFRNSYEFGFEDTNLCSLMMILIFFLSIYALSKFSKPFRDSFIDSPINEELIYQEDNSMGHEEIFEHNVSIDYWVEGIYEMWDESPIKHLEKEGLLNPTSLSQVDEEPYMDIDQDMNIIGIWNEFLNRLKIRTVFFKKIIPIFQSELFLFNNFRKYLLILNNTRKDVIRNFNETLNFNLTKHIFLTKRQVRLLLVFFFADKRFFKFKFNENNLKFILIILKKILIVYSNKDDFKSKSDLKKLLFINKINSEFVLKHSSKNEGLFLFLIKVLEAENLKYTLKTPLKNKRRLKIYGSIFNKNLTKQFLMKDKFNSLKIDLSLEMYHLKEQFDLMNDNPVLGNFYNGISLFEINSWLEDSDTSQYTRGNEKSVGEENLGIIKKEGFDYIIPNTTGPKSGYLKSSMAEAIFIPIVRDYRNNILENTETLQSALLKVKSRYLGLNGRGNLVLKNYSLEDKAFHILPNIIMYLWSNYVGLFNSFLLTDLKIDSFKFSITKWKLPRIIYKNNIKWDRQSSFNNSDFRSYGSFSMTSDHGTNNLKSIDLYTPLNSDDAVISEILLFLKLNSTYGEYRKKRDIRRRLKNNKKNIQDLKKMLMLVKKDDKTKFQFIENKNNLIDKKKNLLKNYNDFLVNKLNDKAFCNASSNYVLKKKSDFILRNKPHLIHLHNTDIGPYKTFMFHQLYFKTVTYFLKNRFYMNLKSVKSILKKNNSISHLPLILNENMVTDTEIPKVNELPILDYPRKPHPKVHPKIRRKIMRKRFKKVFPAYEIRSYLRLKYNRLMKLPFINDLLEDGFGTGSNLGSDNIFNIKKKVSLKPKVKLSKKDRFRLKLNEVYKTESQKFRFLIKPTEEHEMYYSRIFLKLKERTLKNSVKSFEGKFYDKYRLPSNLNMRQKKMREKIGQFIDFGSKGGITTRLKVGTEFSTLMTRLKLKYFSKNIKKSHLKKLFKQRPFASFLFYKELVDNRNFGIDNYNRNLNFRKDLLKLTLNLSQLSFSKRNKFLYLFLRSKFKLYRDSYKKLREIYLKKSHIIISGYKKALSTGSRKSNTFLYTMRFKKWKDNNIIVPFDTSDSLKYNWTVQKQISSYLVRKLLRVVEDLSLVRINILKNKKKKMLKQLLFIRRNYMYAFGFRNITKNDFRLKFKKAPRVLESKNNKLIFNRRKNLIKSIGHKLCFIKKDYLKKSNFIKNYFIKLLRTSDFSSLYYKNNNNNKRVYKNKINSKKKQRLVLKAKTLKKKFDNLKKNYIKTNRDLKYIKFLQNLLDPNLGKPYDLTFENKSRNKGLPYHDVDFFKNFNKFISRDESLRFYMDKEDFYENSVTRAKDNRPVDLYTRFSIMGGFLLIKDKTVKDNFGYKCFKLNKNQLLIYRNRGLYMKYYKVRNKFSKLYNNTPISYSDGSIKEKLLVNLLNSKEFKELGNVTKFKNYKLREKYRKFKIVIRKKNQSVPFLKNINFFYFVLQGKHFLLCRDFNKINTFRDGKKNDLSNPQLEFNSNLSHTSMESVMSMPTSNTHLFLLSKRIPWFDRFEFSALRHTRRVFILFNYETDMFDDDLNDGITLFEGRHGDMDYDEEQIWEEYDIYLEDAVNFREYDDFDDIYEIGEDETPYAEIYSNDYVKDSFGVNLVPKQYVDFNFSLKSSDVDVTYDQTWVNDIIIDRCLFEYDDISIIFTSDVLLLSNLSIYSSFLNHFDNNLDFDLLTTTSGYQRNFIHYFFEHMPYTSLRRLFDFKLLRHSYPFFNEYTAASDSLFLPEADSYEHFFFGQIRPISMGNSDFTNHTDISINDDEKFGIISRSNRLLYEQGLFYFVFYNPYNDLFVTKIKDMLDIKIYSITSYDCMSNKYKRLFFHNEDLYIRILGLSTYPDLNQEEFERLLAFFGCTEVEWDSVDDFKTKVIHPYDEWEVPFCLWFFFKKTFYEAGQLLWAHDNGIIRGRRRKTINPESNGPRRVSTHQGHYLYKNNRNPELSQYFDIFETYHTTRSSFKVLRRLTYSFFNFIYEFGVLKISLYHKGISIFNNSDAGIRFLLLRTKNMILVDVFSYIGVFRNWFSTFFLRNNLTFFDIILYGFGFEINLTFFFLILTFYIKNLWFSLKNFIFNMNLWYYFNTFISRFDMLFYFESFSYLSDLYFYIVFMLIDFFIEFFS